MLPGGRFNSCSSEISPTTKAIHIFLRIIRVDFPCPERNGSFTAMVMGGEVLRWMQDAFKKGADPAQFDGLTFGTMVMEQMSITAAWCRRLSGLFMSLIAHT
jgi:hypothetical protein